MNTSNAHVNTNKSQDMSNFDVAITGSEANEQEVPVNELLKEYPGVEADEGEKHGGQ